MRRIGRALAAAIAALLLATPIAIPPPPVPGGAATTLLFAQAVPLNESAPSETTLGPLRYLEGWALTSDDRRFGAISALAVDGDKLLALSDQGILFRFAPPPTDRVEIIPLIQGPGDPDSKVDRDSESLVLAGDRLWIGFENSNEIWRYATGSLAASAHSAPPAMRGWSANRGAESLARLADGRFLAIREDVDDKGVSDAVLFLGDPTDPATRTVPLRVDPPERYRVTDAAALPDGRLLLLSRAFGPWSGWTARLLLAELPAAPGQLMPVREIAVLEGALIRDNMEAITVAREGDRTIIWMASDDNLFPLQRTLLLKFEWVG